MPNGFMFPSRPQPQNKSRIVVEPAEPKREGNYSDRIKYDPFDHDTWMRLHEAGKMKQRT